VAKKLPYYVMALESPGAPFIAKGSIFGWKDKIIIMAVWGDIDLSPYLWSAIIMHYNNIETQKSLGISDIIFFIHS
jgi:hypothetical protein